jgi:hypothetical protein
VSELTNELRQLCDDASRHARPAAIAEVIKRGDRRRYRTIAGRSIGGLSVAGLGAAVVFTGAFSNPAAAPEVNGQDNFADLLRHRQDPAEISIADNPLRSALEQRNNLQAGVGFPRSPRPQTAIAFLRFTVSGQYQSPRFEPGYTGDSAGERKAQPARE